MIGIINYGLGNVHAFANIYKRLNIKAKIVSKPNELFSATKIVLPGVGAFDWAMNRLNKSGMRNTLDTLVLNNKIPVLGICVGMQILANHSEEGTSDGLGWIEGEVKKFDISKCKNNKYLPHMGWNDVTTQQKGNLFNGLESGAQFYFLHSYYFIPKNKDTILSVTDYIGPYVSSVKSNNVYGVQFHPEKSHHWGIQLLKNFAEQV